VPLRLTTVDAPEDELLAMVSEPLEAPAAVGSNCTVSVAVWLGLSVSGNVAPETLYPAPLAVAPLTVSAAAPVEVSVTVCVVAVFTATLPNDRLDALTLSVEAHAFSVSEKLCELLDVDAVSVAVCAVLTAVAVAVKPALLVPLAICTDAGTVTAEFELARFTLMPPDGALLLTVTVHASVAAPVSELEVQVSDCTDGRIAMVPVPLSATVSVPPLVALLERTRLAETAPDAVGLNRTLTVAD